MKSTFLLLTFCLAGIFISCTDSSELERLKENQVKLEARILKLEQDMKEQMKIDSILIESQKPQPGSLLYDLDKKNK